MGRHWHSTLLSFLKGTFHGLLSAKRQLSHNLKEHKGCFISNVCHRNKATISFKHLPEKIRYKYFKLNDESTGTQSGGSQTTTGIKSGSFPLKGSNPAMGAPVVPWSALCRSPPSILLLWSAGKSTLLLNQKSLWPADQSDKLFGGDQQRGLWASQTISETCWHPQRERERETIL